MSWGKASNRETKEQRGQGFAGNEQCGLGGGKWNRGNALEKTRVGRRCTLEQFKYFCRTSPNIRCLLPGSIFSSYAYLANRH